MLPERFLIRSFVVIIALASGTGCQVDDEADGSSATLEDELDRTPPAAGWRWESSLGVEVAVPDDWKINDTDCNQTDAPSVVRGQGAVLDCLTPEPKTKQIVEIMRDVGAEAATRPKDFSYEGITLGSQSAERGTGETPDGRAAGWLHIPGIGVIVDVRVQDDEALQKVLDSVRVVDVDHNQCATSRDAMTAVAPRANTLVPSDASSLSVCFYEGEVLSASTLIDGSAAATLSDELNRAKAGRNPDVPEATCLRDGKLPPPDAAVVVHGKADRARLEVTFSSCTHRGLSNGREQAQLTRGLLAAIMDPIHSGYGFSPAGL